MAACEKKIIKNEKKGKKKKNTQKEKKEGCRHSDKACGL
jgi:hypothetical protein